MGNGYARLSRCFSTDGGLPRRRRRHVSCAVTSEPYDDSLGHAFCYVRPDSYGGGGGGGRLLPSSSDPFLAAADGSLPEETTTFRAISGASISANASTPLSTSLLVLDLPYGGGGGPNAAFESSRSFASVPLQPVPRFVGGTAASGPFSGPLAGGSDRGFMSGPIERGFMSGPLDSRAALFSGPLEKPPPSSSSLSAQLRRSLSHGLPRPRRASSSAAAALLRGLTKSIARTISSGHGKGGLKTYAADFADVGGSYPAYLSTSSGRNSVEWPEPPLPELQPSGGSGSIQWAQGKAGEDRMHVVVSEEHGWVFVGIYDGFNGPDATDFLLSNLYLAVHRELKGLLWEEDEKELKDGTFDDSIDHPAAPYSGDGPNTTNSAGIDGLHSSTRKKNVNFEENQRNWKKFEQLGRPDNGGGTVNHLQVLKALSRALRKTEETFLDIADKIVSENPELALMGSCVLVMLMKGDDVYLMNVGDSRAVLAQKAEPDVRASMVKPRLDLERINEDSATDLTAAMDGLLNLNLTAVQLTLDHSTAVAAEVRRIKNEHPDDASVIVNDRVKGSLKVTRAFGAGFMKQPKWNDALLGMFRIDYVGNSPYMTCIPFLNHHKLSSRDRFLIVSSDGLFQYFTNQEAIAQVETFITTTPEGDPAQHLVEEVLFRAAKRAGMDFHELLEIPHGDRRRYHDDISIIVISLEGQIWRSCV